jgi:DNA-binding response OmpR family regulator
MTRVLLIDPDQNAAQQLGLACLARDTAAVMAETVCDAVRVLLETTVSLIVVDAAALRLSPREHATLFERVAPGVPVVVAFRPDAQLDARVAFEVLGFRTLAKPLCVEDLLDKG